LIMDNKTFTALVVDESSPGMFTQNVKQRTLSDLPEGEVLIRVEYSSLNYKDALSATGNRGVTRKFPHTPGIDAAGIVEECPGKTCQRGDKVIVTGYDLGMNTPGGFGRYIRVPESWIIPCPETLSLRESMIFGTAGLTAGMSVQTLLQEVKPEDGEILVTGASGGVGSLSVAILSLLGYTVTAMSGKSGAADFLRNLGAARIISRDDAVDHTNKPILKGQWSGVVDVVGGEILTTAVKSTQQGGIITCCGNVASTELNLTVYPFILRGVKLAGIDSQNCPRVRRTLIWNKLANDWKYDQLENLCREIKLVELSGNIDLILQGKLQGRVIISHT